MDIEKLIERLRNNNIENNCHDCALGYYAFEAATALSTLQTENEKLRETVDKYATAARVIALHLKPFCDESLPYDEMIADAARKASDELEQVKKKNKYSAHDVALILSDAFGDSCACNFNGNDEWLPEKCELLDTCSDVVGVACWEQYLKWRGQKEE